MCKENDLNDTKIEDIRSVFYYLDRENKKSRKRKSDFQLKKITADILKVSTSSVINVIDKKETQDDDAANPPLEKIKKPALDGFHKQVIRKIVHELLGVRA